MRERRSSLKLVPRLSASFLFGWCFTIDAGRLSAARGMGLQDDDSCALCSQLPEKIERLLIGCVLISQGKSGLVCYANWSGMLQLPHLKLLSSLLGGLRQGREFIRKVGNVLTRW